MKQKILAFMQNQWFKNPAAVREMFERHPNKRNEIIKRLLFSGCVSGHRLRAAFGNELCDKIIWEEASPQMAVQSNGAFSADHEHILTAIELHRPDVIICFGKIASDAVRQIDVNALVLHSPHPAARSNTFDAMRKIYERIKNESENENRLSAGPPASN